MSITIEIGVEDLVTMCEDRDASIAVEFINRKTRRKNTIPVSSYTQVTHEVHKSTLSFTMRKGSYPSEGHCKAYVMCPGDVGRTLQKAMLARFSSINKGG